MEGRARPAPVPGSRESAGVAVTGGCDSRPAGTIGPLSKEPITRSRKTGHIG